MTTLLVINDWVHSGDREYFEDDEEGLARAKVALRKLVALIKPGDSKSIREWETVRIERIGPGVEESVVDADDLSDEEEEGGGGRRL